MPSVHTAVLPPHLVMVISLQAFHTCAVCSQLCIAASLRLPKEDARERLHLLPPPRQNILARSGVRRDADGVHDVDRGRPVAGAAAGVGAILAEGHRRPHRRLGAALARRREVGSWGFRLSPQRYLATAISRPFLPQISPILRHFSPVLSVLAPGSRKPRKNGENTAQNGRKVAEKWV